LACVLCSLLLLITFGFQPAFSGWYKGNTHTHTINSDGDTSPDMVARWYKEHGYQFVVITDHNFNTDVRGINTVLAAREKFLVLSGEEVTDKFIDMDQRTLPLHMNAVNLDQALTIPPAGGGSILEVLKNDIAAINAAGALPTVNHPNFRWAINVDRLFDLKNYLHFEIYNSSTECNNLGGGGMPGAEAMWDSLLSRGKLVYGVGCDDAHEFKVWGPQYSNPGGAFVVVKTDSLEAGALVEALRRGNFYSSTGVMLKDVRVDGKSLVLELDEEGQTRHTVYFIGRGGRILQTDASFPAVYRMTGGLGYVRAKVVDSNGRTAWTQPVFAGR